MRNPPATRVFGSTSLVVAAVAATVTWAVASEATVDFNRDIRPILSENCFYCHGPDEAERKAGLRLDTFEGATEDRDGVRATVPGDAEASELIARVFSDDPDEVMPPPKAKLALTSDQRELLRQWIEEGAGYEAHWSLTPLERPPLPGGDDEAHPIDRLVADGHRRHGLAFAEEAPRETLLRRVTFDLTGLPPRAAEVEAFLADDAPGAWERVVDRLLASPAYGERMAWDWLDAARYADSNGYQGDRERTMWPWRDWVVRAFNENLPFDRFTVWQLAGDLLPDATFEQRLATGFCRNHPINGEGGRIPEENRVDYVMDMTETMGTVWLGITFNCARCHDHKFDPFTQREYYQLTAFFNQTPVDGSGGDPQQAPAIQAPTPDQESELARLDRELSGVDAALAQRDAELASGQAAWEAATREALAAGDRDWAVLAPLSAVAERQELAILEDGSILARGDNPANDTYTIQLEAGPGTLASVRLEAIRHESLTGGGLARSESGNFVLTGIEISIGAPGGSDPRPLAIASAEATFEQGEHKVATAFDDDPASGWAVWEGRPVDRDHAAVFRLAEPVEAGPGTVVTVVLRHDSPHVSHNLGRFRLAGSSRPDAPLASEDALLLAALETAADARSADESQRVREALRAGDPRRAELAGRREALANERENLSGSVPKVMVMEDRAERRPTFVLEKGLYTERRDEVEAGVPAALPPMAESLPVNRLGLAEWLVSGDNPLTARVTVNRFWQMLFGIGLVKTAEDFGTQGELPPQQALLDWLAADFRDRGWDVKALLRTIVTSRTYRQSSRANVDAEGGSTFASDPENRWLSRGPRFRLPSWMLRDQALAASGLLVREVGGAPVFPYQPAGIWEETSFGNKKYTRDDGDKLYRRSLYTFWRRIAAPPMFFDNADRQVCSVKPFRTNTPLHALYTLNDVTFVEAARVMAESVLMEAGEPGARDDRAVLDAVFRRVLARGAAPGEAAPLLAALDETRAAFSAAPGDAAALLAMGEHPRDESLDPVEHGAWSALCLAVLNLDETLTKE